MEDGDPNPYYRPGKDYGKRIMQQSKADSLMFTVYPFYGKLPVEEGKQNTKYWYEYAVKTSPMESRLSLARSAGRALRAVSRQGMVRRFPAWKMKRSTQPI